VKLKCTPFGPTKIGTPPVAKNASSIAFSTAPAMASPDAAASIFVTATCSARRFWLSVDDAPV
jgi:hypothetical protein